jgi:selenocysteine lyase/cysteine desulfurase
MNCAPIGKLPGADIIHEQGLFVGNHHYSLVEEIEHLVSVLSDFQERY